MMPLSTWAVPHRLPSPPWSAICQLAAATPPSCALSVALAARVAVSAVVALTAVISGRPAAGSGRLGTATVVGEMRNPYKGLRAFQEADAADFQQVLQQGRASAFDKIRTEAHEVYGVAPAPGEKRAGTASP